MTTKAPHLLILSLLMLFGCAEAMAQTPPTGRFDAIVNLPRDAPYVGEPLRLVLRSAVHGRVASDRIMQPALTDFDWRQFGVDSSSEELIDGFSTPIVERTLMIYPLRAGRLTIPSFKLHVVYIIHDNERGETDFESPPLTIDVRTPEGAADPNAFWLPAKSLRIDDRWEPEPDKIPAGETARRVVTIEAEGVTADRLPPLPNFRAPGLLTFAGPVERSTLVTDRGPVGRAVYRWSVRPVATVSALAPAIYMCWFDVAARAPRDAVVPERRVAFLDAEQAQRVDTGAAFNLFAPRPLVAALLAFVSTAALIRFFATASAPRRESWTRFIQTQRLLRALHAAARMKDLHAFRGALGGLSRLDPERWRRAAARADVAPALAAINAMLFAREAPASTMPLRSVARLIRDALRES